MMVELNLNLLECNPSEEGEDGYWYDSEPLCFQLCQKDEYLLDDELSYSPLGLLLEYEYFHDNDLSFAKTQDDEYWYDNELLCIQLPNLDHEYAYWDDASTDFQLCNQNLDTFYHDDVCWSDDICYQMCEILEYPQPEHGENMADPLPFWLASTDLDKFSITLNSLEHSVWNMYPYTCNADNSNTNSLPSRQIPLEEVIQCEQLGPTVGSQSLYSIKMQKLPVKHLCYSVQYVFYVVMKQSVISSHWQEMSHDVNFTFVYVIETVIFQSRFPQAFPQVKLKLQTWVL